MPRFHSSCVSSTSRMKACRCEIRLLITCLSLGLGVFAMLSSTFWVICSSVLLLMGSSFTPVASYTPSQTSTFLIGAMRACSSLLLSGMIHYECQRGQLSTYYGRHAE